LGFKLPEKKIPKPSEVAEEVSKKTSIKLYKTSEVTKGKKLGQGRFGEVCEVTVDSHIAVWKNLGAPSDSDAVEAIVSEAMVMKTMENKGAKHIVFLLGVTCTSSDVILIMEKASNTLTHCITTLSFDEKIGVCIDVVNGLIELHQSNFIYCDLKCDNVLMFGPTAKLCDFGSCRTLGLQQNFIKGGGTAGYQSRDSKNSFQGDIFSFGVFMFELFCGNGKTIPELYEQAHGRSWAQNAPCLPKLEFPVPTNAKETALHTLIENCQEVEASKRPDESTLINKLTSIRKM